MLGCLLAAVAPHLALQLELLYRLVFASYSLAVLVHVASKE